MIKSQAVNTPVWEISVWFPKVMEHMEKVEAHLAAVKYGALPSANLLPKLSENWESISEYSEDDEDKHGIFQGVELLEGWMLVGEEVSKKK